MRSALGKAVAIAAITAAVLEGSLRVYHHFFPVFFFPSSGIERYRGRPHALDLEGFRLNSLGFKDLEFAPAKAPGGFRIAALGDSFAFGIVPYRHNFLTLLEESLARRSRDAEVLNFGITGAGPRDYRAILANEALAYGPDLVVCFVFLGNDLNGEPDEAPLSYLAWLVRHAARALPLVARGIGSPTEPYRDLEATYSSEQFLEIESGTSWVFREDLAEAVRGQVESVTATLAEMRDLSAARQARFLVVLIPDPVQIDAELRQAVVARAGGLRFDFEQPNRWLAAALERREVEVWDLLGPLAARAASERLYKPRDVHWNIAGNRVAAEVLAERLAPTSLAAGPR